MGGDGVSLFDLQQLDVVAPEIGEVMEDLGGVLAVEGDAVDDVVVEVPAVINGKGIQPLGVDRLPKKVMLEQLLPTILRMERGLEAYRTGDRSMLLFNALENQQTRSYQQAAVALDELLAQPENEELAAHFSYPWPRGHESVYVDGGRK